MTPSIKQAIATVREAIISRGIQDGEACKEVELLVDTIERLLSGGNGEEVEGEPEWTCLECGYCGEGFTTITSGGGSDPVDYDVACPECGSTEIRESPQEALTELVQARDTVVAQLEEVKAREAWQEIESAPRDGTDIIIAWDEKFWHPEMARFSDDDGNLIKQAWNWDGCTWGKQPTHWIPVPSGPTPPIDKRQEK